MPSSRDRKRASGISSCESGKKKTRLPASFVAVARRARGARARARGAVTACEARRSGTPKAVGGGLQPRRRALGAERERRGEAASRRALRARARCRRGTAARAGSACPGRPAGSSPERRGGRKRTGPMPSSSKRRRNWSSTTSASAPTTSSDARRVGRRRRHRRHQRGEAGVLALREGGLDAAARIVEHAHARREASATAAAAARDRSSLITSDGQEPTRNSSLMSGRRSSSRVDDAVEFLVGVGEAGEVALVDDRGGEARLGEDHHAGGRLDQVRAGARADDEEEGVLDLAVQPDDAGQAAEHLALAALAQHRRRRRSRRRPRAIGTARSCGGSHGVGAALGAAALAAARRAASAGTARR